MPFTQYPSNTNYVSTLSNKIKSQAATVKGKIDQFGTEWKSWFNNTHLPELNAAMQYGSPGSVTDDMLSEDTQSELEAAKVYQYKNYGGGL